MKIFRKIAGLALVVFIIAQFFRPDKNTSTEVLETDFIVAERPPEAIAKMLKTSCYDCHSNNTKYPWYSYITPVNYWLQGHIDHGKEELNFSEWKSFSAKRKDKKLEEIIDEVKKRHMPLDSYLIVHKDAELTDEQINMLTQYANTLRFRYKMSIIK